MRAPTASVRRPMGPDDEAKKIKLSGRYPALACLSARKSFGDVEATSTLPWSSFESVTMSRLNQNQRASTDEGVTTRNKARQYAPCGRRTLKLLRGPRAPLLAAL